MRKSNSHLALTVILLLSLANVALGLATSNAIFLGGGGSGICYVLIRLVALRRAGRKQSDTRKPDDPIPARPPAASALRDPPNPDDTEGLVRQMLTQGRFALLLRAQIANTLSRAHFGRALEALAEAMALVPDGEVVLGRIDDALDNALHDGTGRLDDEEITDARGRVVRVQPLFLDRYPITNRQYYEFVAAGGYEQMTFWEKSVWPAVLDMVDRSGMPGPRYWQDGSYLVGQENHPVVGISWYEAGAYARWIGKRLPSDAEWVKAGSWPVPLSATSRMQRKYPWGDTMDHRRANLWGSGTERIVPVEEFADGVSVGGVYQLIGNVWEWTAGNFHSTNHPEGELVLPTPMKGIRGGAFDTYFDNQATCQFQSGENPLSRRHNIGFRCAVGVCDLVLARGEPEKSREKGDRPAVLPGKGDQPQGDPQAAHAETDEVHA